MEDEKGLSGWIVLLIIVALAVVAYCLYRRAEERKYRRKVEDEEVKAIELELNRMTDLCWQEYVALEALEYRCNLCRKTLCEEGILFYYQRLWGLFAGQWNDTQLAARIDGIVGNGLHNVLLSRLKPVDGGFTLPTEAPAPSLSRDTYFYRLYLNEWGTDLCFQMDKRLEGELARIARERQLLEEGPNGRYYERLLTDLLPLLTRFSEVGVLENLPPEEVISRGKAFRDEVARVLEKHHIACLAYADATPQQQADWFMHVTSSAAGEMPALVRLTDGAVYHKGVYA